MKRIFTLLTAACLCASLFAIVIPREGDEWDEDFSTLTVHSNVASAEYMGVTDVRHLIISDEVTEIGIRAFGECANLRSVTIHAPQLETYGPDAFVNTASNLRIYVPAASVNTYKQWWMEYADIISAIPEPIDGKQVKLSKAVLSSSEGACTYSLYSKDKTMVWDFSFTFGKNYQTDVLPGVTYSLFYMEANQSKWHLNINQTANHAFEAATFTKTVTDGDILIEAAVRDKDGHSWQMTYFQPAWLAEGDCWDPETKTLTLNSDPGASAYAGNNQIEHVVVGSGVKIHTIGDSAFYQTSLNSVVLPDGLTTIGADAFNGCANIQTLSLPAGISTIGAGAFDNCTQLTQIYVLSSSLADYQTNWPAYASLFTAIHIPATKNITWDRSFCSGVHEWVGYDYTYWHENSSKDGMSVRFFGHNFNEGWVNDRIQLPDTEDVLTFTYDKGKIYKIELTCETMYFHLMPVDNWYWQDGKLIWEGLPAQSVEMIGMPVDTIDLMNLTFVYTVDAFLGEGTEENPYLISSTDDWNALATNVKEGHNYSGVFFLMTDDIAIEKRVGTDADHAFSGVFDGGGHTLTAKFNTDLQFCAPFGYTYGATIKNLHTSGTITTSSTQAGGVVGRNGTANLTLTNVSSDMTINSSVDGVGSHGGLVGYTINATITGCAFTGKLLGENTTRFGGLVGWKTNTDGSRVDLTDCLFAPSEVTMSATNSKTFVVIGGGTVHFSNCYYTRAYGTNQGKHARSITAGEGVTITPAGTATVYDVSGITVYGTGILYEDVLYGANEEMILLNLSGSSSYTVSAGALSGSANPYTLFMPDQDVIISSGVGESSAIDQTPFPSGEGRGEAYKVIRNGILYVERNGRIYDAQGQLINKSIINTHQTNN